MYKPTRIIIPSCLESSEPELPEYTSVMVQESEEMTDGGRDRVHYENLPLRIRKT